MNPKSAIQKGKELERWIVERLKLSGLDTRASRTPGSGNGKAKGDIWNDLGICFEAKNQKNFQQAWFKQAREESMGTTEPVIVWHPPQEPLENSFVMLNWYFFEELLKHRKAPAIKEPDRQLKWDLTSLINIAKRVLKQIK